MITQFGIPDDIMEAFTRLDTAVHFGQWMDTDGQICDTTPEDVEVFTSDFLDLFKSWVEGRGYSG